MTTAGYGRLGPSDPARQGGNPARGNVDDLQHRGAAERVAAGGGDEDVEPVDTDRARGGRNSRSIRWGISVVTSEAAAA
jgi:hypothetical protein